MSMTNNLELSMVVGECNMLLETLLELKDTGAPGLDFVLAELETCEIELAASMMFLRKKSAVTARSLADMQTLRDRLSETFQSWRERYSVIH